MSDLSYNLANGSPLSRSSHGLDDDLPPVRYVLPTPARPQTPLFTFEKLDYMPDEAMDSFAVSPVLRDLWEEYRALAFEEELHRQ